MQKQQQIGNFDQFIKFYNSTTQIMDPQESESSHNQNQQNQKPEQMQAQNPQADNDANNNKEQQQNDENEQEGQEAEQVEEGEEQQNQQQQNEGAQEGEEQMENQGEGEQQQEPKQSIEPKQPEQSQQPEHAPQKQENKQAQKNIQPQSGHVGMEAHEQAAPKQHIMQQEKPAQPTKKIQTTLQNVQDSGINQNISNAPPKQIHHEVKHKQKPQQPTEISVSESQKQKYINALQTALYEKQNLIKHLTATSEKKDHEIIAFRSSLEQLQAALGLKHQQIQQLGAKQLQSEGSLSIANSKIKQLQEELIIYREVGDIKVLQRRVEELEGLTQTQDREIKVLKQFKNTDMIDEDGGQSQRNISGMMPKQYLQKIGQLQTEKQELQFRLSQIQHILNTKSKQAIESTEIMNKMDDNIKKNIQRISELEELLNNQKIDRLGEKNNLEHRIKQLQNYIQSNIHEGQNGQFEEKQRKRKQKQDATEAIQKQKDIVFRQYLKLELDFNCLQQNLKQLKDKYHQASKELRSVKKDMVSKKDYEDVLMRYKKCKACLEKAIRQNKLLRSNGGDVQVGSGRVQSSIVGQQDNNMKRYIEQLGHHARQSIQYFKQTSNIMENAHVQKLKQQNNKKQSIIQDIQSKNKGLQKLNSIFQKELVYKNSLIERVIQQSKNVKKQYFEIKQQKLRMEQSLMENLYTRGALDRLQAKSANLLLRNREIVAEKDNWKQLYGQIKSQYQMLISRDPGLVVQQKRVDQSKQTQKKKQKGKIVQQGQIDEQEVGNQSVAQSPKVHKTSETQTEGLNQLYYKEIKQTLSALKKFPDRINNLFNGFEQTRKNLQGYKKKYDDVLGKFNMKFRSLQHEKNENDSWRQATKKQIISQYQDIRELIENDRLIQCLRKAKNLIQQLEQGQGDEGEANA